MQNLFWCCEADLWDNTGYIIASEARLAGISYFERTGLLNNHSANFQEVPRMG